MRRLIYIPIIHTNADMGSLASALEQTTAARCEERRWERHKVITAEFWQMVSDYLERLDAKNLKIYQDGFISNNGLGKKIIEEGMKRGSKNYEIILNLLNRGAEVVSTEDLTLLEEEYGHLRRILNAKTPAQRKLADQEYERRKAQLAVARDRFIARTINETLDDGAVGLLFLGAYHEVIPHLATDIVVEPLKEPEKVKTYFNELISGGDEIKLERLTSYLTSPVGAGVS